MAITINGSANTIAGLAVGGLPDGTVDADTLATDAVTTVKVADNAVTPAKSTITSSKILQFVAGTIGNTNFNTKNTNHYIGTYLTITPVASDSTLVFTMATGIQKESTQQGFTLKASIDDGSNFYWTSGTNNYAWHYQSDDVDRYFLEGAFGWTRTAGTAGTAETHKIYVYMKDDTRLDFNNYTKGFMHCLEVAA